MVHMDMVAKSTFTMAGRLMNDAISFLVFSVLDILDFLLCYIYRTIDFIVESEWKPCYCSSAKGASAAGTILVGESKIVCTLTSEISDTLYTRSSLVSSTVNELRRFKLENAAVVQQSWERMKKCTLQPSTFIVEMLQGKLGGHKSHPIPRWSDCDCKTCNSWSSSCKDTLFVHVDGAKEKVQENVIFIHGFISSSTFWTETLFPNFTKATKARYRLFAVDLLGFGRSPKPNDSLYTLREHVEMIEKSVIEAHDVKSFHIVAHSLGCILALALAIKHPGLVKSLTLLAPPYLPAPKGEQATQYMMRRIAPRRVWPPIAFGASLACWYEHVSRTICLLICKNHRLWEFLTKLLTRNRMRTYLVEGFCCHTHNAAWHTLHNIICGTAGKKIEGYLDTVEKSLKCRVSVFHGKEDELIPVECSHHVQSRIPRAHVKVVENKDHITIVVGRQRAFARELEQIWKNSTA